ncbi:MAG TPA: ComEA family DNA-binding protein [Spongiibacteraceae bacterium]|jgi:competence protein ComEA
MEFRTSLRPLFFSLALLTASTSGWCAKEAPAEPVKAVNINTADAATLADGLKGVGQSKAEAIVAYRKEHGPFKSIDQLAEVKGIGDKLVQRNHDRIVVK